MTPQNEKATGQGGFSKVGGGQAKTKHKRVFHCNAQHISNFCQNLAKNGLALRSTAADTQLETLPKVLQFLGTTGLNTYEGTAASYLRTATRIKELKETWEIHSLREDVIGPDGLYHRNVARYVLIGKKKQLLPPQMSFDLEAA